MYQPKHNSLITEVEGEKELKILMRKHPWIPEKNWELQLDRVPSPN